MLVLQEVLGSDSEDDAVYERAYCQFLLLQLVELGDVLLTGPLLHFTHLRLFALHQSGDIAVFFSFLKKRVSVILLFSYDRQNEYVSLLVKSGYQL